jgi:hypothetical protein
MLYKRFQALLSVLFVSAVLAFTPAVAQAQINARPISTHRVQLNVKKFPQARQLVLNSAKDFPVLHGHFEVLDPTVGKLYNCIAHTLGIHNQWVNPKTGPANNPLQYMDQMYQTKGYKRIPGLDFRHVLGMSKVIVYAKMSGNRITEVTHGALQSSDGVWTSKLGQDPLIKHLTPQALNGPCYGQPVAVYVRYGKA